ncbi:putative uncharacterized protein [Clostridium sp. CAG:632]|nr:hypothetical protein [Clostridium sp.]CCY58843.1 putative uncharacterized protein [Clostridium sp. CAG:632]
MDENYLDQLLKNVEEDDVVTGSGRTGITEPEKSDMGLDMEKNLETDSSNIQGVAWSDAEIPTEEISELDELDKLADMDMNDMDFADIDFDDIDVTKMDYDELKSPLNTEDINDLQIDEKYLDEPADNDFEQEFLEKKQDESAVDPQSEIPDDTDIDAMFKEVFGDEGPDLQSPESVEMQHIEEPEVMDEQEVPLETEEAVSETEQKPPAEDTGDASSGADMDDLFAMLGLDANTEMTATVPDKDEIPDFEIPPEMEDLKDLGEIEPEKKKKSFMDVLFGEDDSDEPTPEELEEKRQKKEEAKLKRKEENKEKKAAQNEKKQKNQKEKQAKLASKKAARKAEEAKLLAAEGPEKKLNKPLCVIVILFFLCIGGAVILGTNVFDYTLVITKATTYFERQKYGMAYREILGVNVKEQDKDLESRIYTVMYVERQYEAYENYRVMDKPDKALDSLLQGLAKYDDYYQEAQTLNILDDYNYAKNQIVTALNEAYGMTEADALELLQLPDQEYTEQIRLRSADVQFNNSSETSSGNAVSTEAGTESENTVEDVTQ